MPRASRSARPSAGRLPPAAPAPGHGPDRLWLRAGDHHTGLAAAVAPGRVIGVDPHTGRLETAQTAAAEQGLANLLYEPGDIHALPLPDRDA